MFECLNDQFVNQFDFLHERQVQTIWHVAIISY